MVGLKSELDRLLGEWRIQEASSMIAAAKGTSEYTTEVMDIEKIIALLNQAKNNLLRGRAIATGIGAFAVVTFVSERGREILLRRRKEKDSIIYGQDLSGKWELIGGGMEISDLIPGQSGYQGSVAATIRREALEEAALDLSDWEFDGVVYQAMLARYGEEQALIDESFSILIPWRKEYGTSKFDSMIRSGELCFVPIESISEIEIVSPRMRSLIEQAIEGWNDQHRCRCDF